MPLNACIGLHTTYYIIILGYVYLRYPWCMKVRALSLSINANYVLVYYYCVQSPAHRLLIRTCGVFGVYMCTIIILYKRGDGRKIRGETNESVLAQYLLALCWQIYVVISFMHIVCTLCTVLVFHEYLPLLNNIYVSDSTGVGCSSICLKDPVVQSRELFASDAIDTYPVSAIR